MNLVNKLYFEMLNYFKADTKRCMHLSLVYSFAHMICEESHLEKSKQQIVESVALIHDIGIKMAEAKYNTSNGKVQEEEGPSEAKNILVKLGYSDDAINRICYIIGHHHTYSAIDDIDFQILVEADLMANFYEDKISKEDILSCYDKIFKTEAGIKICEDIFDISHSL